MLSISSPCKIKGWILDAYPSNEGEITVWIISEVSQRIQLKNRFQPKIYASSKQESLSIKKPESRFIFTHVSTVQNSRLESPFKS